MSPYTGFNHAMKNWVTGWAKGIGQKFSGRSLLTQYRLFLLLLFPVLSSCFSPRESCNYNENVNGNRNICLLMIDSSATCSARIISGQTTQEKCNQVDVMMLLICMDYLQDSSKCADQPDWPKL